MILLAKKIADNSFFQSTILFLIMLNGVLIGLSTYEDFSSEYGNMADIILWGSQVIFTGEILIRIASYHPNKKYFFMEFWNNFDFIIILLSYIPGIGFFIIITRLLRLLKLLRIFSVSQTLRDFLTHMKGSVRVLIYSGIIYMFLLYIFAVAGYYLFSHISPSFWGDLHTAIYTSFLLSTFSDIKNITHPLLEINFASILFFLCFFGIYITLFMNTFAAVIKTFSHK